MSNIQPTHIEREPHELDSLLGICNYKGCLVTKLIGSDYQIFGKVVKNPEEVDNLIKVAGEAIEKSLTTTVRDGFYCQNAGNDLNIPDKGEDGTYIYER